MRVPRTTRGGKQARGLLGPRQRATVPVYGRIPASGDTCSSTPGRMGQRERSEISAKAGAEGSEGSLGQGLMKYDAFLLDQFGVLHDGQAPYPGALRLVQELYEAKKRLVILSNSSRRSDHTFDRLAKMGFDPNWFAGAITSGDVASCVLNIGTDEIADSYEMMSPREFRLLRDVGLYDEKGQRLRGENTLPELNVLHLTWSTRGTADDGFVGSIDLNDMPRVRVVNTPQEADVILIHGTEAQTQRRSSGGKGEEEEEVVVVPLGESEVDQLLRECAGQAGGAGLPMLVANPDEVTVAGDKLVKMPGAFAVLYHMEMNVEMDRIHLLGKPNPLMYEMASKSLLEGIAKSQVLAVGDSLNHDIRGANDFGIQSLFITSGIHSDELPPPDPPKFEALLEALGSLCAKYRVMPTMYGGSFE